MEIFTQIENNELEEMIFFHEKSVGLKGVIAIHNTILGPALSGVRMLPYKDSESMIKEAIQLASEMTWRSTLSGCDLGGASAILWGEPEKDKFEAYFRAFGRFLNRLGGRVYGVMDLGINQDDFHDIYRETGYVLALPESYGGIADAIKITTEGFMHGIRAATKFTFGTNEIGNITFLVQGVGRLGSTIVAALLKAGGRVIVTDTNYDKIKNIQDNHPDVTMIRPEDWHTRKCDIFVPCAQGNLMRPQIVDELKFKVIAGIAGNLIPNLKTIEHLHNKGIHYIPNFVIDAGELIQADHELNKRSVTLLPQALEKIYFRALNLLERAKESNAPPTHTALGIAKKRLQSIKKIRPN
ncbi:Glu/Leu/Phe/Val dehydrogenase dimerization domain-containing protein [Candidatus Riflebacteria bacterium]